MVRCQLLPIVHMPVRMLCPCPHVFVVLIPRRICRPCPCAGVAAYLYAIGETTFATVLFLLVLPQMFSQISFLQDPVANDVKYQAAAQPFLVFGILTTALAVGHHTFA